jgi:propanediol dehydratase small subunit
VVPAPGTAADCRATTRPEVVAAASCARDAGRTCLEYEVVPAPGTAADCRATTRPEVVAAASCARDAGRPCFENEVVPDPGTAGTAVLLSARQRTAVLL